jgi:uncharacterized protein (TIGR00255 family)
MTGFARSHGASGPYTFEWELKSVNAKGFDLRFRVPQGWDELEAFAKKRAGEVLSRGTVYANLNVKRSNAASAVRINEDVLASIVKVAGTLAQRIDAVAPSIDGLLGIKGVIEVVEPESDEAEDKAAMDAAAKAFEEALDHLVEMRRREGAALGQILQQRMDQIERLAKKAEAAPGRKPEAIRARLAEQIAALLETSDRFDPDRLTQEAILIATKADIREELDRIASHIAQAREMIGKGGPVGRRLDFLAQEFNREVNTCCSKSNDIELTNTGLEMKNVVEQGELLEWATVFDNRYGTPRVPVEAALSAGQDVLFDIDWQGTQQLREKARADVVSVFILPPSAADLEKRLHTRAQDSEQVIRGRMNRATHELSHWAEYDYIVVNQNVDDAFAEVQSILKAERLKRERRVGLTEFVRSLQRQLEK